MITEIIIECIFGFIIGFYSNKVILILRYYLIRYKSKKAISLFEDISE